MTHSLEDIKKALQDDGAFVYRSLDVDLDINLHGIEEELDTIGSSYNEQAVKIKMFRQREDHPERTGDACMSTVGYPKMAPFLTVNRYANIMKLQMHFNAIIGNFFDIDTRDSKSLLNWQRYRQGGENSLPFHADCEMFEGEWKKDYINFERALIPRFVLVLVTTNENDGEGLYLRKETENIELNLDPGDMVIFDNTKMLHGVPVSTPNKRAIVGLRNFESFPLLFQKTEFKDSVAYENGFLKGFVKELSPEEAVKTLIKEGIVYA